jgi:hypothetical protein
LSNSEAPAARRRGVIEGLKASLGCAPCLPQSGRNPTRYPARRCIDEIRNVRHHVEACSRLLSTTSRRATFWLIVCVFTIRAVIRSILQIRAPAFIDDATTTMEG